MGQAEERMAVGCIRCGAAIDITPGSEMPEDGSRYRVWHCRCGMAYELARQAGLGYLFVLPESTDDDDGVWDRGGDA